MTLLEEALQVQERRSTCKLCEWLVQQPASDQMEWADAMDNPMIEHQSIHKILQRRGCKVSYSTLQRHRINNHDI